MNRSTQAGMEQLELTAEQPDHARLVSQLVPLAQFLAQLRGEDGVTVSDLRREAVQRRILPAESKGREFAFLGAVMKRAGLVRTGAFRRSDVDQSHGNLQRVWVRRP